MRCPVLLLTDVMNASPRYSGGASTWQETMVCTSGRCPGGVGSQGVMAVCHYGCLSLPLLPGDSLQTCDGPSGMSGKRLDVDMDVALRTVRQVSSLFPRDLHDQMTSCPIQ